MLEIWTIVALAWINAGTDARLDRSERTRVNSALFALGWPSLGSAHTFGEYTLALPTPLYDAFQAHVLAAMDERIRVAEVRWLNALLAAS